MKVEYGRARLGNDFLGWYWHLSGQKVSASGSYYTRRRDAVRGFERFCAAIRRVK